MSILARFLSSGNSGGVVQVIQPPTDETLRSYQLPVGIAGQLEGETVVRDMPPGRYTETQPPNDGWVWLEDTAGKSWRLRAKRIRAHALEPEAHTAKQCGQRRQRQQRDASDWLEQFIQVAHGWEQHYDYIAWDDDRAHAFNEAITEALAIAEEEQS